MFQVVLEISSEVLSSRGIVTVIGIALSLPSSPVITQALRLTYPRAQRIFLKPITIFKREPISVFPIKHRNTISWVWDSLQTKENKFVRTKPAIMKVNILFNLDINTQGWIFELFDHFQNKPYKCAYVAFLRGYHRLEQNKSFVLGANHWSKVGDPAKVINLFTES